MQDRKFLIVDMDAFFVSCETAAFPELKGKPVAVCTGRQRGGVVASASYEARKYGIKTGMPSYMAKKLCPALIQIPADITKYAYISEKIMTFLRSLVPLVEVFSVDEAFLDVSSVEDAINFGRMIKKEIRKRFSISATVGIGPSRVIAKIACEISKPDGLREIKKSEIEQVIGSLEIEHIPGIGERNAERLKSMGIRTVRDLLLYPEELLCRRFGVRGLWYKNLARGEDAGFFTLLEDGPQIKSIGHSETFPRDIFDIEDIKKYTLYLSEKVARRLRCKNLAAKGVSIYVRYFDFSGYSISKTYSYPLHTSGDIYKRALSMIFGVNHSKPIRLIGISVFNLVPYIKQLSFYVEDEREELLARVVDEINDRYGDFTVRRARLVSSIFKHNVIPPRGIPR